VGELISVPYHPLVAEDEGWLISFACEPVSNTSKLLVFDATNISIEPVASVQMPVRISYGFHGGFIREPFFLADFQGKCEKEVDWYKF